MNVILNGDPAELEAEATVADAVIATPEDTVVYVTMKNNAKSLKAKNLTRRGRPVCSACSSACTGRLSSTAWGQGWPCAARSPSGTAAPSPPRRCLAAGAQCGCSGRRRQHRAFDHSASAAASGSASAGTAATQLRPASLAAYSAASAASVHSRAVR